MNEFIHDPAKASDVLGDVDRIAGGGTQANYAKVGSSRPSSLLYTYGPGAVMDLPNFTVLPHGFDAWERIWARLAGNPPSIHAPRLLEAVRTLLGNQVDEIRPFPWQPTTSTFTSDGAALGVSAMVFPQWMRCTGCDRLAPLTTFGYVNRRRFRPDEAAFWHKQCHGRRGEHGNRGARPRQTVPARYLLACTDGHLDEFPYDWWVHEGAPCPGGVAVPVLEMLERVGGKGASATIVCTGCQKRRTMTEAQGEAGQAKLPRCRGRHPHLEGFEPGGCDKQPRLMVVGASNLWFPALQSIIDMPRLDADERKRDDADRIRVLLGDKLAKYADNVEMVRDLLEGKFDTSDLNDAELAQLIEIASQPPEPEAARQKRKADWDPVDLLVPEWRYLQRDPATEFHADARSGLTLSPRAVGPSMPKAVDRVLAVDRLRKINALVGFTRIDELERVNDLTSRLVRLSREDPKWVVGTEDRGEGVFVELDEDAVASWESAVADSRLWEDHRAAHERNYKNRFSETAANVHPDTRLRPPRYWLLHTLAHLMIREMAMSSGYGAASLSERIYAWQGDGDRPAAAGLLICTTASDSDGTLGGLVRLSQPDLLERIVLDALFRATRCSSDPVCAKRSPKDPEDFLHGAACHCCVMASETSCERANRFLDRRFLVQLPDAPPELAFFGDHGVG